MACLNTGALQITKVFSKSDYPNTKEIMKTPILSICIPTYNRAIYLEEILISIISQRRFQETNDVEIVISDNCSEDNTTEVCEKYIEKYSGKIRYYRNDENIHDANFEKVLSYGNGVFLKLNNDTLKHYENTLDLIIRVLIQNNIDKNIIFFTNGYLNFSTEILCENLNSFVKNASYWTTWIGSFGIWKEDFDKLENFSRNSKNQLVQTDVLLRQISSGKSALVVNIILFEGIKPKSKGGYNFFKVFVIHYLDLLEEYKKKKLLSRTTLFNEKTKLMRYFIIPWVSVLTSNQTGYSFDMKGMFSVIFKKFRFHPILYIGVLIFLIKKIQSSLKTIPLVQLNSSKLK